MKYKLVKDNKIDVAKIQNKYPIEKHPVIEGFNSTVETLWVSPKTLFNNAMSIYKDIDADILEDFFNHVVFRKELNVNEILPIVKNNMFYVNQYNVKYMDAVIIVLEAMMEMPEKNIMLASGSIEETTKVVYLKRFIDFLKSAIARVIYIQVDKNNPLIASSLFINEMNEIETIKYYDFDIVINNDLNIENLLNM